MDMRKLSATATIVIAIQGFSFTARPAQAGLSARVTERVVSADGHYVLVTISDRTLDEEMNSGHLETHAYDTEEWITAKEGQKEEVRAIRAKYRRGGMYLNDGSTMPLWTCDTQWPSSDPIIAPDGDHVIFPDDWIDDEEGYGISVVTFTYRGQVIRRHLIDFIPQILLKSVLKLNGMNSPSCIGASFDPRAMTYAGRTNQREEFVFDAKSGSIVAIHSPFPTLYLLAAGVLAGITAWIGWRFYSRRARH
jgi:hypothetical protein